MDLTYYFLDTKQSFRIYKNHDSYEMQQLQMLTLIIVTCLNDSRKRITFLFNKIDIQATQDAPDDKWTRKPLASRESNN